MTVYIDFRLDCNEKVEKTTVQSPFADVTATRDNLNERLDDCGKALMPVRDADTGNYVFVNTMKLASIEVREEEEG